MVLSRSRVSLLVVVVAAIVLLASLLAYEAHDAARSERLTAARARSEYAFMAASEFRDAFRQGWISSARQALGAATAGLASSPFEPPLPLSALRPGVLRAFPCPNVPDSQRELAFIDLRSGRAESQPSTLGADKREALVAEVRRATQRLPAPEDPYLLSAREGHSGFLVIGVRFVRLGAPIGIYAFTVCNAAVEEDLPRSVTAGRSLLPPSITGSGDNAGLLHLVLRRSDSSVVWSLGDSLGSDEPAFIDLDEAGLRLSAALRSTASDRFSVGPSAGSRLPLLISLLLLTFALGAVALVQLRREHDLARMRADFTSSVSHELRTPLTQILLYGETLQLGRARTSEDRRFAADTIVQEAGRLMHMVENMLSFARTKQSKDAPHLKVTNLERAIADTVATFQPLAASAHMKVEIEGSGVWALVDPGWFRQVLLNLLDNAVKYGRAGQRISISVSRAGERARVIVADQGTGIPASDRERVWMPYVRLAGTATSERGGTGLGLTVVRELVDAMHGRVWVEDAPGGGAAFVLECVPAEPPQAFEKASEALVRAGAE